MMRGMSRSVWMQAFVRPSQRETNKNACVLRLANAESGMLGCNTRLSSISSTCSTQYHCDLRQRHSWRTLLRPRHRSFFSLDLHENISYRSHSLSTFHAEQLWIVVRLLQDHRHCWPRTPSCDRFSSAYVGIQCCSTQHSYTWSTSLRVFHLVREGLRTGNTTPSCSRGVRTGHSSTS